MIYRMIREVKDTMHKRGTGQYLLIMEREDTRFNKNRIMMNRMRDMKRDTNRGDDKIF